MMDKLTKDSPMIVEIKSLLKNARKNEAQQVNTELLTTYWQIGRIIVEYEQKNEIRAEYGKQTLKELAKVLSTEFGKGFSRSNLQNMRALYMSYEKCQTLSGKLTWSHYCELLSIWDESKRSFYEKETVNSNWSVREMKRQINSSFYERLLLSDGEANKEKVLSLARHGVEMAQPSDMICDPYVFELLGIPEDKPLLESDLEKALVQQIEKFLLELGRGFMFVGTQQRVTVNDPDDNPPIGIILCTDKDSITAEYALGGLSNNVFASRYVLYIPNKEQLIAQVEAVLEKWHGENKEDE